MSKFVMMVGLPGSGKSTVAHGFVEENGGPNNWIVLSTDDWIDAHAAEAGQTYDEAWPDMIKDATTAVNAAFQAAVQRGDNILWDQTNLGVKKRKSLLRRLPDGYEKSCIVVKCADDVRTVRLLSREGKTVPASVLRNMAESFVPPVLEEGFDVIDEVRT